jgi:hypothetical protein
VKAGELVSLGRLRNVFMNAQLVRNSFGLFALAALAVSTSFVSAQVVPPGNPAAKNPVLDPNSGNSPLAAQAQLTPEQFQNMAQLRYLQSRRRGQVRTGVPQFIPFGPGAMMPPSDMQMDDQGGGSDRKSSTQKRMEARKVRDEQKKAAREDALAKKAKNGKPDKKDAAKAKKAKPAAKDNAKAKKAKADVAKKKSA